jgi:hypothetical protein
VTTERIRLVDAADEPGRTTAALIASLSARLGLLHLITGAAAVGSLTAGFAALGREVARTSEGARLRAAIDRGRPGSNGDAIWSALQIGNWATAHPPSPVLEQLRNDVALLLAEDVHEVLARPPMPNPPAGSRGSAAAEQPQVEFADYLLGMWAFASEVVRSVEALAAPTMPPPGQVARRGTPPAGEPPSSLLR